MWQDNLAFALAVITVLCVITDADTKLRGFIRKIKTNKTK